MCLAISNSPAGLILVLATAKHATARFRSVDGDIREQATIMRTDKWIQTCSHDSDLALGSFSCPALGGFYGRMGRKVQ